MFSSKMKSVYHTSCLLALVCGLLVVPFVVARLHCCHALYILLMLDSPEQTFYLT